MHIRLLYKKVLYVFLSLVIVIFPIIEQANAASSWNINSATSAGARTIVGATSGGFKSAVNMMPTAGRLGLRLLSGANTAALIYAALQLGNDGIDHVLDPANNSVRYKKVEKPTTPYAYSTQGREHKSTIQDSCAEFASYLNGIYGGVTLTSATLDGSLYVGQTFTCKIARNGESNWTVVLGSVVGSGDIITIKHIPINQVAAQVIKNAAAGHAASQAATRETATEMVVTGDFDADLLSGAVPVNDSNPLIPAVPGNRNGNVTHGAGASAGESDGTTAGAAPGAAADAARDAADAARKAAGAAADAAKSAADAARKAADDAKDLVSQSVDQAIKDAANAAAAAASKAAADAKAVSDAAAKSAADAANAAAAAADANAKAAAKAAADAAAAAAADASNAAKAAAKEAADAAKAAADAAKEAADAAAKEAAERLPKDKPFELPAFCTWASVVCDYTAWVKDEYAKAKDWVKEEPVTTPAEMMPIDDDPSGLGDIFQDKAEAGYVSFESSCPADVLIPVDLMGVSQTLTISYTPFCHFASLIRYAVILGAWISGLLIVTGGRSRE